MYDEICNYDIVSSQYLKTTETLRVTVHSIRIKHICIIHIL